MHRVVLVGCGLMADGWLEAIQSTPRLKASVSVVGLVDLDVNRAKDLAGRFGLATAICGSSLDAVIEATKPDMLFDIVVPPARAQVVKTGLRAGCHVLSEKPMAMSLEEGRELIAAAKQAGRIHAIIQNRRYIPGIRRLRRAIEEGLVGEITALHADFFVGAHFGGFREEMDHVLLLDMSIHTMDAARFMIGTKPLAVYCHETNPKGSWYRHGAAANAIFEFDGGAVFTYRGSWCAEGANTSWESRWRIVGSKGTILWDGADEFQAGHAGEPDWPLRKRVPVPVPDRCRCFADQRACQRHRGILDAVETGAPPETISSDNINSLAMVLAAVKSAETGVRVTISN